MKVSESMAKVEDQLAGFRLDMLSFNSRLDAEHALRQTQVDSIQSALKSLQASVDILKARLNPMD